MPHSKSRNVGSVRPVAALRRLCLIAVLLGAGCASARAQDRFDFTYSGSGIVAARSPSALVVGPPPEQPLLSALTNERRGSMRQADDDYAEAVRRSNYDPRIALSYAHFMGRRGRIEEAWDFLVKVKERWPDNPEVLTALAQIALTRQDWVAAQDAAQSIRNIGDPHTIAAQIEGAALVGQGKVDEAIAVYQSAAASAPSAEQPMALLVAALVRARKTDQAVAVLDSALQANPDNAAAYILMGSILATDAPKRAEDNFRLAIEKHPDKAAGYVALARFQIGGKNVDDAIATVRSGLQRQPEDMMLRLTLAGALEQTGQYEAAIAEYEHMLRRQPNSLIAANNLASLLSDRREDEASLARARTLAASLRESQVPQFMDTLGWVSYRTGDYKDAVLLLTKAAAALPERAIVRYHLGMSFLANRQAAEAAEQLTAALALSPDRALEEKIRDALRKMPD